MQREEIKNHSMTAKPFRLTYEEAPWNRVSIELKKEVNYRFGSKIHFYTPRKYEPIRANIYYQAEQLQECEMSLSDQKFTPLKQGNKEMKVDSTASKARIQVEQDSPQQKKLLKTKPIFKSSREVLQRNRFGYKIYYQYCSSIRS